MSDRKKVIKGLEIVWDAFNHMEHEMYADYVFEALVLLRAQRPRVHGRWIDENPDDSLDPRMRCSICTGVESPLLKWRYCPNCGAKMDGERRKNDGADS